MRFFPRLFLMIWLLFDIKNLIEAFEEDPNRLPTKCESKY
jgi:hypothetical protein